MAITSQQAFRLGFLMRCAEEGCDDAEVARRATLARYKFASLKKQAGDSFVSPLTAPVRDLTSTAKELASPLASLGKLFITAPMHLAALGVVGGGLAGAGAGYGLAKMDPQHVDLEEVKRQELTNAYRTQAEALLRRTLRRMQPV